MGAPGGVGGGGGPAGGGGAGPKRLHGGLQPPGLKQEAQHLSVTFLEDFQYGFSTCCE